MNHQNTQRFPASPSAAKAALLALFEAFPADRGEGTLAVGTYLIAIEGYSLRAIEGAVRRIIRGEADDIDRRFLPSPAQLGNVVAYLEKLYAPPEPMKALPAPGNGERTADEQARAESFIDRWRRETGRVRQGGEVITDREAVPAARLEALDKAVSSVAQRIKAEGLPPLSEEAMALFRQKAEMARPDPSEDYDQWDKANPSLPNHERSAA